MQIYIIPTYDCNLNCESCYAKKYQKMYPNNLSWKDFICIYDKFKYDTNNISFIGGEVTKWKFITEAILFLKNKNKNVTLFSNGLEMINAMPNNVIINGSNLFDGKYSSTILKNVESYKKNNVKVTIRFNVGENFGSYIQDAIRIAEKYGDLVSISALYPVNKKSENIGKFIFQIAKELSLKQIQVKISRATPLCLFTKNQMEYLEENCGLKGKCTLPTSSIVINPDGKSIQPCVELPIIKNIDSYSKSTAKSLFSAEIDYIINGTYEECSICEMYKNKKCCGGCLSYK